MSASCQAALSDADTLSGSAAGLPSAADTAAGLPSAADTAVVLPVRRLAVPAGSVISKGPSAACAVRCLAVSATADAMGSGTAATALTPKFAVPAAGRMWPASKASVSCVTNCRTQD